jgi:putative tricarboxylic transport membrane protein
MKTKTVSKTTGYLTIGAFGVLLTAGYTTMALQMPLGQWDRPGAAVFPIMVTIVFGCASLATMWEGWRTERAERVEVPSGAGLARILGLLGALLGYYLLLPWLGQLIAGFGFCLALMRLLSNHSWVRIGVAAAIVSLAVYVVFIHFLKVPMPRGVILAP